MVSTQPGRPDAFIGKETMGERWREGIAVVGMSARFPGCKSVDEYWARLAAGDNLLSVATGEELAAAGVGPETANAKHFVRSGTRLEEAENFDAKFWDVSRREAETMDPQQRIFLECAYEALEHAGMTGDGARVGVFAGSGMNTYMLQLLGNSEILAAAGGYQLMLGNDKDFLATRAAYKLNLRGPAVAVQTACSTSLAAVHLACQSLLRGECDAALAGGVSVMFPQVPAYEYVPGMILSPDGVCRPFDERAHGTVPGRGAGLVVLKRVSDAVAEGDTIYAVIAGSAWNNDGSGKVGYTAPSVDGQAEVIRMAQAAAGVLPDRIGYVEAHGTGTELGDPIEVAALAEAFGEREPGAAKCVLGSVKANMGHADVAAGVAGLIKAVMAVHHGVIPGTPHFERANPALGLELTPFEVSADRREWPAGETEHWAGVSSFGIGGTNVHLCLKSAPVVEKVEEGLGPWVFAISAKTATALEASAERLVGFVTAKPELALPAVAATLQTGRRAFAHRRAVVAGDAAELIAAFANPNKAKLGALGSRKCGVAFLFPGQGLQFGGMAAALYARDARFRTIVDRGLSCLPAALAAEVLAGICTRDQECGAASMGTSVAQPLLFLVEYALAMRWLDAGVVPSVLVGHSLGELTAATVAGVFSFEDGLRLAAERGRLMQATPEGAMLAVSLAVEDTVPHLSADLWIAAENAPKLTVISGPMAAIEAAEQRLAAARVPSIRLKTDRAFHTPDMAEAAAAFQKAVAGVERSAPKLPWLSNVTGSWIGAEDAVSPQYWADQMTARVRFAENAAIVNGAGYFLLEVGPGDALGTLVRQLNRAGAGASSLGGPKRRGDDFRAFLETAARLWEQGTNLDWKQLPGYAKGAGRIALPTYPFERERFFVETTQKIGVAPTTGERAGAGSAGKVPQIEKRAEIASWFYAPSWQRTPAVERVLVPRAEPIATWLAMGASPLASWILTKLEQGGARIVSLQHGVDSPADLPGFWKENRETLASRSVGLIVFGAADDSGAVLERYAHLLGVLQTAVRARVRFAQMEFVLDALVDVHGERVQNAGRAVMEGLARMLPSEFTGVQARVIDPGVFMAEGAVAAAELVVSELGTIAATPSGALTVALRSGVRWQQNWLPLRLEASAGSRFRQGGTYVITGGLGGIGYVLARHLLTRFGARVALLSRTALPQREQWEEWLTERGTADAVSKRIERVKELERLPGELLMVSADVADAEAMEFAWAEIEGKLGAAHGVIHAAGLANGDRIAAQTPASVERVFRPKLEGSVVVAELLAKRAAGGSPVDFLLFCSSISALVPLAGASAYAAANAFQDRYATWCRQHLGIAAVSINFDAWQEVGMAADAETVHGFEKEKEARLTRAMGLDEGVEVVERILASGETEILVSTVDFALVLGEYGKRLVGVTIAANAAGGSSSGAEVTEGSNGIQPGPSEAMRQVQGKQAEAGQVEAVETLAVMTIWQELLGADEVGPRDNFFELGGHSLLGTMVLSRIREKFGVELGIRAIFEAPTPEGLGARVRQAEHIEMVAASQSKVQTVGAGEDREEFEI